MPGEAQTLKDLTLIDLAGYNLLTLFGAKAPATGPSSEAPEAYAGWQKRLRC